MELRQQVVGNLTYLLREMLDQLYDERSNDPVGID